MGAGDACVHTVFLCHYRVEDMFLTEDHGQKLFQNTDLEFGKN
jgi:hypothetical protein